MTPKPPKAATLADVEVMSASVCLSALTLRLSLAVSVLLLTRACVPAAVFEPVPALMVLSFVGLMPRSSLMSFPWCSRFSSCESRAPLALPIKS